MKLLLIALFSFSTFAYTLGIYTDQADPAKARDVIAELKRTYPFSIMDINYQIIPQTADELDCGFRTPGIDRLPTCNSQKQRAHARRNDIDQALVIMDHEKYGGSGGSIPVMTTNSPPSTMVHEYLHTLGLCDEYEYSQSEADYYCPYMERKENSAIIEPKPSYPSDVYAKSEHSAQIMWFSDIESDTPITNGRASNLKLGTGDVDDNSFAQPNYSTSPTTFGARIGLYRGNRACKNSTKKVYLWHPGNERNIMERLDLGLGRANEVIVTRVLLERGAQYKPEYDPSNTSRDVIGDGGSGNTSNDSSLLKALQLGQEAIELKEKGAFESKGSKSN